MDISTDLADGLFGPSGSHILPFLFRRIKGLCNGQHSSLASGKADIFYQN